jgi:hypothetical protein
MIGPKEGSLCRLPALASGLLSVQFWKGCITHGPKVCASSTGRTGFNCDFMHIPKPFIACGSAKDS